MTKYWIVPITLIALAIWHGNAAPPSLDSSFEKIKSLEGKWEGHRSDGQTVKVHYSVHADGSAVLETLIPADHPSMLTVYHMDGPDLRMTHYCAAKNQPRMKAESASTDGTILSFGFVDATNLEKPSSGHMHNLEITFLDSNHIRQKWTWSENGRTQDTIFDLARVG